MNIKEYITELNKWAKLFPNATVVYSSDEEGNSFEEVYFHPRAGSFISDGRYGEFKAFGDPDDIVKSTEVNAICVN